MSIFLVTKKAPVVEVVFLGSNLFCVYRCSKLVFPTPGQTKISSLSASTDARCHCYELTSVAHDHNLRVHTRSSVSAPSCKVSTVVFCHNRFREKERCSFLSPAVSVLWVYETASDGVGDATGPGGRKRIKREGCEWRTQTPEARYTSLSHVSQPLASDPSEWRSNVIQGLYRET
jgi:hypothetical protein